MSNVPYQEEVRPGELRHALRGYSALGYPPAGYTPTGNGNIIIIIMAPPQTAIPDWRNGAFQPHAAPPRQSWPAINWRAVVQIACVFAIVGAVGWIGYSMTAGDADSAGLADLPADSRAWLAGAELALTDLLNGDSAQAAAAQHEDTGLQQTDHCIGGKNAVIPCRGWYPC